MVDWDAVGVEVSGLGVLDVVVPVRARLPAATVVLGVSFEVSFCMMEIGVVVCIEDVVAVGAVDVVVVVVTVRGAECS